jgi:RNA polymerase sigma-70 factor, ECF subfamily
MLASAELSAVGAPVVLRPWRRAEPDPVNASVASTTEAGAGSDSEEVALLLAVGRGDRGGALTELYRRYERRLYGLGLRLLGDRGLAEELVQETFVRVWRTAGRYDPARGSVSTFIFVIARRLAIDLWRRPSSRPLPAAGEPIHNPEQEIDQLLLQLAVRDALDTLTDAHRQVLELSYQSDLTQSDIAGRLGLSLGTVKSRTYHALRAFQRAAKERGIDG